MNNIWQNHPKVNRCVDELCRGGVIAYPTEAVWGLGCHPYNESAVATILAIKSRPWHKGLILVAGDMQQVDFLTHDLTPLQKDILRDSWPGHTTWLIEHRNRVPWFVVGRHETVAVRVSTHPIIQALCKKFGGPIVSTSANPAGHEPARDNVKARKYFNRFPVTFCAGRVGKNANPSTIKHLHTGETLR